MTNDVLTPEIKPAYRSKFIVTRTPKKVDMTMLVRRDGQEMSSRTLMTPHHASALADALEHKKDLRIVLGDGAGSVELQAPGAPAAFHFVIVRGKTGSLEGLCEHGDQWAKLITELRDNIAQLPDHQ